MDDGACYGTFPEVRPPFHPAARDITVEGVLHALADPVRVQIFAGIASSGCPQTCSTFIVLRDQKLAKSTLSQHFRILREAGLIRSERKGVEMHNTARCGEFAEGMSKMIAAILGAYGKRSGGGLSKQLLQPRKPVKRRRAAPAPAVR